VLAQSISLRRLPPEHTFSDAIYQPKPLVDANECLFEAGHIFGHRLLNFLIAAVLTLFEWIYALVQSLLDMLLFNIIFMNVDLFYMALQGGASFGHG
jgi:hypothetical protein